MYLNKVNTNWLNWLPLCEFWYNSITHKNIGKSSFEIIQGLNPRNLMDTILEIEWNMENKKAVKLIDELL
jgi:hypothetical protein